MERVKNLANLVSTALVAVAPIMPMNSGEYNGGGCQLPDAPHHLRLSFPPPRAYTSTPDNPYPKLPPEPVRFLWETNDPYARQTFIFVLANVIDTSGTAAPNFVVETLPRNSIVVPLESPYPYGESWWRWIVVARNDCGYSEAAGTVLGIVVEPPKPSSSLP